ncbi:MAG: Gfo/Idh/MocA family oxidoreductase [Lentisphaeria bacterium]|nr:Gfo/Idh/MocA family oxidoreductase [Lentisphaeria bacterium]
MIHLALYGCGRRTRQLLDALRSDDFYCVHACYDIDPAASESMVKEYGGSVCKSSSELLSFPGVDAFLISLNPLCQASALRETIPARKPIFIEKPVAFTGREAHELAVMADEYFVPVQVGFMRRYLPECVALFDYLKRNDPGRLFSVSGDWFHHGEGVSLYFQRHDPGNFRLKMSQIPFHCVHMLDVLLAVGGPSRRVTSQTVSGISGQLSPSPDDFMSQFEFANGGNGRFHYTRMSYFGAIGYQFHFENCSIKMNNNDTGYQLQIYPRPRFMTSRIGPTPDDRKTFLSHYDKNCQPMIFNYPAGEAAHTENIMYDFVRMVRDGVPPEANLHVAARVQGLAEAMELSGALKKSIELDEFGCPVLPEEK